MTDARTENYRSPLRFFSCPSGHFFQNICKGRFSIFFSQIQHRGKLGHSFANPLILISIPRDAMTPPLMSNLMGKIIFVPSSQINRTFCPLKIDALESRQLVQHDKRCQAMAATLCASTVIPPGIGATRRIKNRRGPRKRPTARRGEEIVLRFPPPDNICNPRYGLPCPAFCLTQLAARKLNTITKSGQQIFLAKVGLRMLFSVRSEKIIPNQRKLCQHSGHKESVFRASITSRKFRSWRFIKVTPARELSTW